MAQAVGATFLLLFVFDVFGESNSNMVYHFQDPFLYPLAFGERHDLFTYVESLLRSKYRRNAESDDLNSDSSIDSHSPSTMPSEIPDVSSFQDVNQFSEYTLPKRQSSVQLRKRIHTCVFMSRLGLPIGLCFPGTTKSRKPKVSRPSPPPKPSKPKANLYDILEKHWPVHSMLGGGVGRK